MTTTQPITEHSEMKVGDRVKIKLQYRHGGPAYSRIVEIRGNCFVLETGAFLDANQIEPIK